MGNSNKYWKGLDELHEEPSFVENRGNEFNDALPIEEAFSGIDNLNASRRDFLKFFGFSVSAVALAACNKTPVKYAIPYLNKPENVTPGIPLYYATSCGVSNEGYPIMAKVREGRPIKLDGNQESSLSQGSLNAIGQASILSLYDINRLANPLHNGEVQKDWSAIDKEVITALDKANASGKAIKLVHRTNTSPLLANAIVGFTSKYSNAESVVYDPISYSGILNANEKSFGRRVVPTYAFDKANVIASFGADFLGTWLNDQQNTADYTKNRVPTVENPSMSTHFQIESLLSVTGSNADYRFVMKTSDEGVLLASLYNAIAHEAGKDGLTNINSKDLAGNGIAQMAKALWDAKGKSLVVSGSNDSNNQTLVNGINVLLENYGTTIDIQKAHNVSNYSEEKFDAFVSDINRGNVGAVIFLGMANPVYSYRNSAKLVAGLAKVGSVISTAIYNDETTSNASIVAPEDHWLESWNVFEPNTDSFVFAQPTISKVLNTRSTIESLLTWSGVSVAAEEGQSPVMGMLKEFCASKGIDYKQAIHDGTHSIDHDSAPAAFSADLNGIASSVKGGSGSDYELLLYTKVGPRDGTWAVNPWCHELPDPITKVTYDNYITMSKSDAVREDIDTGDFLSVTLGGQKVELPMIVQPGQASGTLGIALGYGRMTPSVVTNDLKDLGKNVYNFTSSKNGTTQYSLEGATIAVVNKSRYEFALTQTHHTIEGRDFLREATLDEYKENPRVTNEHSHHLISLWDEWDYSNGHHWGMAIDMNACTGCGSCIVSCSIENNVPVVGRDEVRRRREMHWIRIDRYYAFHSDIDADIKERWGKIKVSGHVNKDEYLTGEKQIDGLEDYKKKKGGEMLHYENIKVVHQPLMCQHCDNASCESVCPVLATTHSNEGLNQMTYNRCIGTKYCANNCAYKVRRFNWFKYKNNDNFDYHFNNELGKMVLNPDVTVRSRGVMEKCSFCVQNIQTAKLSAKRENRTMKDGEVTMACARACPSNAIVFGDMNDKNSELSKLHRNERSYGMLEELNTVPSVKYLTKIRNRKENAAPKAH
jgi:MoCo/4Fe-4S cofactor protein with predicted Tat translocation signal